MSAYSQKKTQENKSESKKRKWSTLIKLIIIQTKNDRYLKNQEKNKNK
jgi:hypothetical protein